MIIRLPFPSSSLSPNRKNGKFWGSTIAAKKAQREYAYNASKQAAIAFVLPSGYIPISLLYLTPDKRHRDLDNLLAASKSAIDGIASALGIDDSRFKPILIDSAPGPDKVGALVVGVGVRITTFVEMQ